MKFFKITWALPFFALLLAGCEADGLATPDPSLSSRDQEFLALAPKASIPSQFQRYEVADPTGEKPGTVVVDTKHMYLYYVLPGGKAMRYLGARAMYLFQGNKDTLYRIHGTNEPEQIGQAVSSGCIRMSNIDAIDLYNRVKLGTKVIVE
jgi:lipoprotein-anchoring transpeptidase ErfK/SrfK